LDTYGQIKLINFIRSSFAPGSNVSSFISGLRLSNENPHWAKDEYLRPVLQDDPLLSLCDTDDWDEKDDLPPEPLPLPPKIHPLFADTAEESVSEKNRETQEDNEPEDNVIASEEAGYFGTYAHYEIHNDMLKDTIRTTSYRDFFYKNSHLIKDKVVLDVGCGTGILSMFAAKCGARKVIAVDHSDIISHARAIIQENNMQDVIIPIQSKIELIENLEKIAKEHKVDIIVSEWMGYCLLFECMLPSILIARDRFCSPNGLVFPDVAEMFIGAWSSDSYLKDRVHFWDDVYGFKMTTIKRKIISDPHVDTLPRNSLITSAHTLKSFDINSVGLNDLDFFSEFKIVVRQPDGSETESKSVFPLHGFVVYFDIHFRKNCTNPISFSTGPESPSTHWHHTLFILKEPYINVESGDVIIGSFKCKRHQHHRDLELLMQYQIPGKVDTVTTLPFLLL